MAPKTRAKSASASAGAKDPNPKLTIKSKLYINTHEDDSKKLQTMRSLRCFCEIKGHGNRVTSHRKCCCKFSAESLDSIEPVDPRKTAEVPFQAVLLEWNGRRPRSGLPKEDVELEVAAFLVTEDFRSRWASESVAATMVQMKKDPNYSAPVQK